MERLTIPDVRIDQNTIRRSIIDAEKVKECAMEIYWRLKALEDAVAYEESEEYDIDRLREMVEADRDGRCVVLPCKPGTPVYRIVWHVGCAQMDDESYKMVSQITAPFTLDMVEEFGRTIFLTRKAAEAALKGEQDGR